MSSITTTGIPALDAIIKATSKKFNKDFGGTNFGDIKGISTGSVRLDAALGIGGLPEGSVVEIFGWQSSGKTSLALSVIKTRQEFRKKNGIEDKRDLIVDLEHSITESFLKGFGIDMQEILWVRPETAEEALQIIIDYPKSGHIDIVIFDSVDSAQNSKMLSKNIGDVDVGGISKDMNNALRRIVKIAPRQKTTYIFINQIKQNPGVMMGNPNVTTGGNALKYYSMCRLELMTSKPSPEAPGLMLMRAKIDKTKVSQPIGKDPLTLYFLYGKGFHKQLDLFTYAKDVGVLKFAGPTAQIMWKPGTDFETLCTGGKAALSELLEDEKMFQKVKNATLLADNKMTLEQYEKAMESLND